MHQFKYNCTTFYVNFFAKKNNFLYPEIVGKGSFQLVYSFVSAISPPSHLLLGSGL